MPRPPKQKLKLDYDSLQSHIQEVYNQLDELKQKAIRDYNKVQQLMVDPTSIVSLEATRNNSLKALGDFHKSKLDLLKVHLNVVQSKEKQSSAETEDDGNISTATSEDMQKWYKQLADMKKEKGGV
jgi:LPS O-antigen subunit length determinant protein (WzzB/FepE family)